MPKLWYRMLLATGLLAILLLISSSTVKADTGYLTTGLVSVWDWARDHDDVIVDSYGWNNGINHGSVLYTLPDGTRARSFNGRGQYINCGNSPNLDVTTGDWTIDTVVMFNNTTSLDAIAGKITFHDTNNWGVYHIDNIIAMYARGSSAGGPSRGIDALEANTWYHIIATQRDGFIYMWVNGVNQSICNPTSGNYKTAMYDFLIGSSEGSDDNCFYGSIQYVRFYDIGFNDTMAFQNFNQSLYALQTTINSNAANNIPTVLTQDYNAGEYFITFSLPNNTTIIGNGHVLTDISFEVNGANNILVDGIINNGTGGGNSFASSPFSVYGTSNNITFNNCTVSYLVANTRHAAGFFIAASSNAVISNVTITNCKVDNTNVFGYALWGDYSTIGTINNVYIADCTANMCGSYNSDVNGFATGFDLGEDVSGVGKLIVNNVLVENCTASNSWESGFHREGCTISRNTTINNCTSYNNGIKPNAQFGSGFIIVATNVSNCVSWNNSLYGFVIAQVKCGTDGIVRLNNCRDDGSGSNIIIQGNYSEDSTADLSPVEVTDFIGTNAKGKGAYLDHIYHINTQNFSIVDPAGDDSLSVLFYKIYSSNININYNGISGTQYGVFTRYIENTTISGNIKAINNDVALLLYQDSNVTVTDMNIVGGNNDSIMILDLDPGKITTIRNCKLSSSHGENYRRAAVYFEPNRINPGTVYVYTDTMQLNVKPFYSGPITLVNHPTVISIREASYTVNEDAGSAIITIDKPNGTAEAYSVDYTTSLDPTDPAENGIDFISTNGTLNFGPGMTSGTVTVPVLSDGVYKLGDTHLFLFKISNPSNGAMLGDITSAEVVITEASPGEFRLLPGYDVKAKNGSIRVAVNRVGGSEGSSSVGFSIVDGTARYSRDYTLKSGTLTFGNGETSKEIVIPLIDQTYKEDKDFKITLNSPKGGGTIGDANTALVVVHYSDTEYPGIVVSTLSIFKIIAVIIGLAIIALIAFSLKILDMAPLVKIVLVVYIVLTLFLVVEVILSSL